MMRLIYLILLILWANAGLAQLNADFSTDNPQATYCLGDTVFFTNNSSGNYVATHWFFGDGTDTWTDNPFHIYQDTGSFTVRLVIYDENGDSSSVEKQVTINLAPKLTLINDKANQTLTAHITPAQAVTFHWYFNGILTDETDSVIYYYESGIYAVSAVNSFGCSDSAAIEITIGSATGAGSNDTLSIIVANNVLTPNNDGINDVLFIQDLSTYKAPCQVIIYNKWGQMVYRKDNYTNIGGFDGHDLHGRKLPAGTYYYVIRSQGRKTATGFIDLIR